MDSQDLVISDQVIILDDSQDILIGSDFSNVVLPDRTRRAGSKSTARDSTPSAANASVIESAHENHHQGADSAEEEQEVESSYENGSDSEDYDDRKGKGKAKSSRTHSKKKSAMEEVYSESPRKSARPNRNQNVALYVSDDDEDEDDSFDKPSNRRSQRDEVREGSAGSVIIELTEDLIVKDLAPIVVSDDEGEEVVAFEGIQRPQDRHTLLCLKCGQAPLPVLFSKFLKRQEIKESKGVTKKRSREDEDSDGEEEILLALGSWINCGVCIGAYHFGCLHESLKKEFVFGLKEDHANSRSTSSRRKIELDMNRTFTVKKCWSCKKSIGRRCFECGASGRKTAAVREAEIALPAGDEMVIDVEDESLPGFMFRCIKCNRAAHYDCLPAVAEEDLLDEAGNVMIKPEGHKIEAYFKDKRCHECFEHDTPLELILAWREVAEENMLPTDAAEADDVAEIKIAKVEKTDEVTGRVFSIPSAKNPLAAAEYLVKWQGKSYRQLEWISHSFLASTATAKLSHFLLHGSRISLDVAQDDELEDGDDREERLEIAGSSPLPDPDAEARVPPFWRTVDRVLDVEYLSKTGKLVAHKEFMRGNEADVLENIAAISTCYMKWIGLAYSDSTHEEPPKIGEEGYEKFLDAYNQFIAASHRDMRVPNLTKAQTLIANKPRPIKSFTPLLNQPEHVSGGTLMPFQLEGVNFMKHRWWTRNGCILADEMGLGKTVQIITLLSSLAFDENMKPFLVTVPNSTIGNWIREFAKWSPKLRVVPYMGDATSRSIIEDFEMFDNKTLKCHVVLCTYESLTNNINVFKRISRWECLVVDEGQRLKGGSKGLLFKAINSLIICHRIILTGTPLNNNLGELYNLLSFINPKRVLPLDLKDTDITPQLVVEIRNELKPYFLRRTKETSLDLPPLNELVVEVTMTPLQRKMYIAILSGNSAAMNGIYQKPAAAVKGKKQTKVKAANFNNILMELRKLLGHPYLISPDIERIDVTPLEAHENLVKASAKLEFLDKLLPKLHAAGHRVLIFSQFKITLNILEDFLRGINLRYLRLDGDTKGQDRQRGIDAYQAENSPYFIYLLSTRAGGVGINLTKADTVIMFDQDFNPFQDLQAVARAHRFGQVNPVQVFKLLVKDTCEEKIFKDGGRKMGLDHLIIQRLDADTELEADVSSLAGLLQYGAKVIFDEARSLANAIHYTDADIDALIGSVYKPAEPGVKKEKKEDEDDDENAGGFAHARIWEKAAGITQEVETGLEAPEEDLKDFWANILAENDKDAEAAAAQQEDANGRGKRTRKENPNYLGTAVKASKIAPIKVLDTIRVKLLEMEDYEIPEMKDEMEIEWEDLNAAELSGDAIPDTAPGTPDGPKKARGRKTKVPTGEALNKIRLAACERFMAKTVGYGNEKLNLLLEGTKEELTIKGKGKKSEEFLGKTVKYLALFNDQMRRLSERRNEAKPSTSGANSVGTSRSSVLEYSREDQEDLNDQTPREPTFEAISDGESAAKKQRLE